MTEKTTEEELLNEQADEIISLVMRAVEGCENPNCELQIPYYIFPKTKWVKEGDVKAGVEILKTTPHWSGKHNVCEIPHPNAGKTVEQVLRDDIKKIILEIRGSR